MNFYVSFYNNNALKLWQTIKYVWQLTTFVSFNSFYFYCNLFCLLLTDLFIYLFFYFVLCIIVVDLLPIKKNNNNNIIIIKNSKKILYWGFRISRY